MRTVIYLMATGAVAIGFASCAQPERPLATAKPPRRGSHFSGEGKVSLHAGQPCASQIMFDFRGSGALGMLPLAAPMSETRLLTDAARRNRRVRIWGNWRTGAQPDCRYVQVAKAEPAQ